MVTTAEIFHSVIVFPQLLINYALSQIKLNYKTQQSQQRKTQQSQQKKSPFFFCIMANCLAPTKFTDCHHFLDGKCNIEKCHFRHCEAAKTTLTDCEAWPQCRNMTCPGRHQSTKMTSSTPSTTTTTSKVPTTDETQRTESVTMLWDLENVAIPRGQCAFTIVLRLKKRLIEDKGLCAAKFMAYCNSSKLSKKHALDLEMAGVDVINVADGDKQAVDRRMYLHFQKLTSELKPPATIVLISSDKDFIQYLGELRFTYRFTTISIHNTQVNEKLLQVVHASYPWTDFISDPVDELSPKATRGTTTIRRGHPQSPINTRHSLHNAAEQQFKCPLCPLVFTSANARNCHQIDTKHW